MRSLQARAASFEMRGIGPVVFSDRACQTRLRIGNASLPRGSLRLNVELSSANERLQSLQGTNSCDVLVSGVGGVETKFTIASRQRVRAGREIGRLEPIDAIGKVEW